MAEVCLGPMEQPIHSSSSSGILPRDNMREEPKERDYKLIWPSSGRGSRGRRLSGGGERVQERNTHTGLVEREDRAPFPDGGRPNSDRQPHVKSVRLRKYSLGRVGHKFQRLDLKLLDTSM